MDFQFVLATSTFQFLVVAAFMVIVSGFFVSIIVFALLGKEKDQKATQEAANQIGARAPANVSTDEIFEKLEVFSLLDNVHGYKKARSLVVYPSEFGEVQLFWFSFMFKPKKFPVKSVLRRATVMVCPNNFGIANVRVSTSWFYRIRQHFWGDASFDRRLDEVLPDSIHRCDLEIAEQGTMLYYPRFVFSTGDIPKLIADFENVLSELQKISNSRIE